MFGALPVEREKHEDDLAFPKPLSVNDPDPEYQFTHRIADDGSVIPINSQEEVLVIGEENEPIIQV